MFGKSFHEKLVDINKVKYVTVASRNWGGYGSKDPNQTVNRDYSNSEELRNSGCLDGFEAKPSIFEYEEEKPWRYRAHKRLETSVQTS